MDASWSATVFSLSSLEQENVSTAAASIVRYVRAVLIVALRRLARIVPMISESTP